jgi:tetratricopeptide (TPR) repeat protein
MRLRDILLMTLLAVATVPAVVRAQDQPGSRVLVMPFVVEVEPAAPQGAGAALWLGEAAAILLGEHLSAQGVGTLSRDQRVSAFDEINLPMSSVLTRATTLRVAELIGATEVVFGEIALGQQLSARARIVRLGTGHELAEVQDEGPLDEIFGVFSRVAADVAAQTGRLRTAGPAPSAPMPLEVFENYVKGLVAATPAAQQRFLESATRVLPSDPRILMALWGVYSAQAQHEKALASANAVPAQVPLGRTARFAVALSLIELRRFDGAYQILTTLHGNGRDAALSNALGVVQLRRPPGTGGSAPTVYFRRAVDEEAENTDYLFNLGYAHARAGNQAEALTWLREMVRLDAASGDAHLVMSAVLASANRVPEAARELELALLLSATVPPGQQRPAATVPEGLERLPASPQLGAGPPISVAIANPAQRDQRETAAFHLANGKTLIAADRDREAANELRRAIYLAPYDHEPHLLLGQLYQRAGQLPQAIDELTVAIWCQETAAARLALARALIDSGETEAARREIARARVLAPNSTEATELLERIGR